MSATGVPSFFPSSLLFGFIISALQLEDTLVVVVDCSRESTFRAVLADDEVVEVLFQC